jgi:polysaccharide export outer membrane protein
LAEVVLGPGDVVKASVYGSPDLAIETRVSEGGSMTFPLLGEVQVGGLSTQQAEKKIGGLLEKGGYLKKAQVNLLITTLASQQVSVLGQVNRPGRYPVEGKRKVLDLLAIAGGVNAKEATWSAWCAPVTATPPAKPSTSSTWSARAN